MFRLMHEVKKLEIKDMENCELGMPNACMLQKNNEKSAPYYCFFDKTIVVCAKKNNVESEGFIYIPKNPEYIKMNGDINDFYYIHKSGVNNNQYSLKNISKLVDISEIESYCDNQSFQDYLLTRVNINSVESNNIKFNIEINKNYDDPGETLCSNLKFFPKETADKFIKLSKNLTYKNYIKIYDDGNFMVQFTIANNIIDVKKEIPPMCIWTLKNIYLIAKENNDFWLIKIHKEPVEKTYCTVDYVITN